MANFIEGILSPLKTASSLLQEAIEIRDATKFRDTVGKLQTQILSAQQGALAANVAQAEMAEEISQLKKQVASLKAWNAEKNRYQLKDVGLGSFARVLKESESRGEPPHQICAACYERGKKFILQPRNNFMVCPECGTEIKTSNIAFAGPIQI
jgi:hypothetical protein